MFNYIKLWLLCSKITLISMKLKNKEEKHICLLGILTGFVNLL